MVFGVHRAAGDLAARYVHRRDEIQRELRRTGTDPSSVTEWTWQT